MGKEDFLLFYRADGSGADASGRGSERRQEMDPAAVRAAVPARRGDEDRGDRVYPGGDLPAGKGDQDAERHGDRHSCGGFWRQGACISLTET